MFPSVDLYFELLEPKEKGEVFEDLVDGKDIGLPDFYLETLQNYRYS